MSDSSRVIMTNKYEGPGLDCKACKKPLKKGDRVYWVRGVPGVVHVLCSNEQKATELREKLAPSRALDAAIEVPAPAGRAYRPFQRGGIAFAAKRFDDKKHGTLIGDQPGLGKTLQAIGLINCRPEIKTALVVCPASLRINWKNEATRWMTRPNRIWVAGEKRADHAAQPELFKPEVLLHIVSPNMLGEMIEEGEGSATMQWDLLILDEIHIYKTWKAKRSAAARRASQASRHVLGLTGTPIPNEVIELFPILSILEPFDWDPGGKVRRGRDLVKVGIGEGAGMKAFGKRYCGATKECERHGDDLSQCEHWCKRHWTYGGSSNLDELQEALRTTLMVRRLKRDVLAELPPKVRQVLKVPADEAPGVLKQERAAWKELGETPETLIEKGEKIPFEKISAVRHELGVAKVPFVLEEAEKILEAGEKVVIFGHHRDVLQMIHAGLLKHKPVLFYGGMNDEEKDQAVRDFQEKEEVRVFVGAIMAAGVGLTLHAASYLLFAEESWRPLDVDQAEDREHRIGQTRSVNILHIVFDRSLDARMVELIVTKQEIADLALDVGLVDEHGNLTDTPERRRSRELREMGLTEEDIATLQEDLVYAAAEERFPDHARDMGRELAKLTSLSPRQAKRAMQILGKNAA